MDRADGTVTRSTDGGVTWAPDGVAAGYQPRVAVFDADDAGDALAAGAGVVSYRLS